MALHFPMTEQPCHCTCTFCMGYIMLLPFAYMLLLETKAHLLPGSRTARDSNACQTESSPWNGNFRSLRGVPGAPAQTAVYLMREERFNYCCFKQAILLQQSDKGSGAERRASEGKKEREKKKEKHVEDAFPFPRSQCWVEQTLWLQLFQIYFSVVFTDTPKVREWKTH